MNVLGIHPKCAVWGKVVSSECGNFFNVFAPATVLVDGISPANVKLGFCLNFPIGTIGTYAATPRLMKEGVQVTGVADSSDTEASVQVCGGHSTIEVPTSEPIARLYVVKIAQPRIVVLDKKPQVHPDIMLSKMMMPRKPMNIMKMPGK